MSEADYRRFFAQADKDGDGNLSVKELSDCLKKNGYTDAQCQSFFESSDYSGDGKLSMDEFLQVMGVAPPQDHKEAMFRQVFNDFDKDRSGFVDAKELAKEFNDNMKRNLTPDEILRLEKMMDTDGDGKISFDEFKNAMFGQ